MLTQFLFGSSDHTTFIHRDGWKTSKTFFSRLPKGKKTFCVAAFIPFCLHGSDISRRARAIRLRVNVRTWLFPELLKAPFMGVAAVSVSPYKAIFGPFSSLDQREKLPFESGVVNLPRSRAEECIVSMPKVGERPLSPFWPCISVHLITRCQKMHRAEEFGKKGSRAFLLTLLYFISRCKISQLSISRAILRKFCRFLPQQTFHSYRFPPLFLPFRPCPLISRKG